MDPQSDKPIFVAKADRGCDGPPRRLRRSRLRGLSIRTFLRVRRGLHAPERRKLHLFGRRRVGPFFYWCPPDPRGSRECVLRPFLGEMGCMSHVVTDVLADPGKRLTHFVQMLSKLRLGCLIGHGSGPRFALSRSKYLEVDAASAVPSTLHKNWSPRLEGPRTTAREWGCGSVDFGDGTLIL